jgi:uncharacterized membrane protein
VRVILWLMFVLTLLFLTTSMLILTKGIWDLPSWMGGLGMGLSLAGTCMFWALAYAHRAAVDHVTRGRQDR